jgi:hypothetical protein
VLGPDATHGAAKDDEEEEETAEAEEGEAEAASTGPPLLPPPPPPRPSWLSTWEAAAGLGAELLRGARCNAGPTPYNATGAAHSAAAGDPSSTT